MNLFLRKTSDIINCHLNITGSKSETNRLLLLQSLFPNIIVQNTSSSDDSLVMQKALMENNSVIDIHHAGTAMRFLTAYFAFQPGREVVITGSERMQERPIKILVDALTALGADISYVKQIGFPPLRINGKNCSLRTVSVSADVSSQYISALLLMATKLKNGIELILDGKITSVPYINMTLALLNDLGIETSFRDNVIRVEHKDKVDTKTIIVESDWSSASYYYSIIAMSGEGSQITLSSFKKNSLQGDSALSHIYKQLGVGTVFGSNNITIKKQSNFKPQNISLDLNQTPDIAQTIAVCCFGMGIGCELSGLHTLKIKETDRLVALQNELLKLGAEISVTNNSLSISPTQNINQNISISTYNDHRMAMSFATLATKVPILIENADVVSKSYPEFWEDLSKLGFG